MAGSTHGEGGSSEGMLRLYRMRPAEGGIAPVADWIAESESYRNMLAARGRWFTDDLQEALWYAREHPQGEIVFVDLPRAEAETFRVSRLAHLDGAFDSCLHDRPAAFSARPDKEFFVSREIAVRAAPLPFDGLPSVPCPAP